MGELSGNWQLGSSELGDKQALEDEATAETEGSKLPPAPIAAGLSHWRQGNRSVRAASRSKRCCC